MRKESRSVTSKREREREREKNTLYLKVSIGCLIIALIAVWHIGCATATVTQKDRALSYCVPESIYSAWVWGAMKKDKVRLVVQKIDPAKNVDHVQAEALIEGKWTPLTPNWSEADQRIMVTPYKRHFNVEPYRYLTLKEWIDEQIRWTGNSK